MSLGDDNQGLISYSATAGGAAITSLTFTGGPGGTWQTFQDIWVDATDDGVVRGFHRSDLLATTLDGYSSYLSTVTDRRRPLCGRHRHRVRRLHERRRVLDRRLRHLDHRRAGQPSRSQDSYTVKLTMAPGGGEDA